MIPRLLYFFLVTSTVSGVYGLTCGSCADVLKPKDCNYNTTCASGKLCGVNQFITTTSNEWRFELKCMSKMFCDALAPLNQGNNICVKCCDTDLCNKHLCENGAQQTVTTRLSTTKRQPTTPMTTITAIPTTTAASTTTASTTTTPMTTTPTTTTTTPTTTTATTTPMTTATKATPTTTTSSTTPATSASTTTASTVSTTTTTPLIMASTHLLTLHTGYKTNEFYCRAAYADTLNIYENGTIIQTISLPSTLEFHKVVKDWKNVTYRCEGVDSKTNQKAVEVISVVATGIKPYFPVKYESEIFARDGDHIGLSCIPEGDPKPALTWTLPKLMDRQAQSHISYHYEKIELEIQNMGPGLAGTYTCAAHNPLGTSTVTYHVRYVTSSQITQPTPPTVPLLVKPDVYLDKQINVTKGATTIAIPCAADGIPKPTITWSVAQGMMPSNVQQYENYLILHNVGFQDSRYFICTATNKAGTSRKIIHVIVVRPNVPPKISLQQNLQIKYHSMVKLVCQVTGYPKPTVTWSFNGKPAGTTNELTISKATLTDIGAYTCTATNKAGQDKKTLILLVTGTPPVLVPSKPSTVIVSQTKKIILICTVTGEPTPNISWNFKPFVGMTTAQQSLSADNSTLTLSRVDKSGTATCVASNPFGQVQSSFSIIYTGVTILGR